MNPLALLRGARRRLLLITLAGGVPLALALGVLALRVAGFDAGSVVLTLALLAVAAFATWRARRLDARWLVARLDQQPRLEDSADLLFAAPQALNPLQQRQRARIEQRLRTAPPDLRPRWPWPRLLACIGTALLVAGGAVLWPRATGVAPPGRNDERPAAATAARPPALRGTRLEVTPPAYTGQPALAVEILDARALQGSHLRWQLRLSPQPQQVWLQFHDGRRLPLQREGDYWQASQTLQRSGLYRIVAEPALAGAGRAWRLQVVPDRPPQVKVIEPAQTLTRAAPRQRRWALRFEASDDFGVAADAVLELTSAKGSGENIDFQQRRITLAGSGPASARRFAYDVDLDALGVGAGDEVVARLGVRDNRAPQPQEARSPSLILRLPSAQEVQTSDLEGAIKKVMPAYFRSQRQIIIDAEALLKQRGALDADTFTRRADAIGVDQRILRLRYGQFLGEEAEGGAKPPPTADAPAGAHADDDGHDHDHGAAGNEGDAAAFGSATDVLAEYGHTHDHAEAATLLDPQTRAILKAALDQMWQSEGALRQGHPDKALPYAYKALGFIKQVQQAERVYLARVGPELPPIDMARRMGGKRDGLGNRDLRLPRRAAGDTTPVDAWRALATAGAAVDLDAVSRWLEAHPQAVPDPLDIAAAIDALRQQPDCDACRQRLRDQLWPALPRAPGPPARREAADAMGRRYLDALAAPQETAR